MSSLLRKVLVIAAVLVGLLVVAVGLAFLPGVQTWAARRALASQPDLQAELGQLSVGLGGARVTDLVIEQPGLKLTLPSAEIDLPLVAAARGRVDISRFVARGWTVELTDAAGTTTQPPAGSSAKPDPRALFDALRLPVALSLAQLDVQGRVRQAAGEATVTLTGGGLRPGEEGRFELDATFTPDASAGLPAGDIDLDATLTARLRDEQTLDQLGLDLTAKTGGNTLRAKIASRRAADGADTHAVSVIVDDHALVSLDLALAAGSGQATGGWKLDVRDRDVAPFLPGQTLPAFTATGEGRFSSDPQGLRPEVSGALRVALSELERLSPELASLGALNLDAAFELALAGEQVAVRAFKADLSGAAPVLSVEALQPFTVDPAAQSLQAKEPLTDLARISLTGLPLAWAQPWLGDLQLTGGPARGEWRVTAEPSNIRVRPVAALTVEGISLEQAGQLLLRAVDLSVAVGARYRDGDLAAELLELSARSGGRTLLKASGQGSPAAVKGTLEAELPALFAQPVAKGAADVVAGRIQADFDATLAEGWQAGLNLAITGLRASQPITLPEVSLKLTASGDKDGVIRAELPVVLTAADRRSDLLVKADVKPGEPVTRFAGSVTGALVHVQDLQVLAALAPSSPAQPTSPTAPATKPAADEKPAAAKPFWAGYEGKFSLSLARVVYAPGVEVKDVTGELSVDRDAITLKQFDASIGASGRLSVNGSLKNEPAKKKPYVLAGDLSLTGFDPGPFLKPDNARRPPVLEGSFDVKGTLAGRAVDPAELADTALGKVDVTGRQGTLRALGVKVETAANLARPASALLGLVGAATGNEDAIKYAERARAGAEVAQALAAVQFDRLDMTLQRAKNNDLAIKDIVLQAPAVRLTGGGGIQYQPGVPLLRQPLNVQLNLSAKDRLAKGLASLKLVGAEADAAGYFPLTESIQLDGSLAQIGASQLERLIRRALTQ